VHAIAVRAGRDVFVADFSVSHLRYMNGFVQCSDGVLNRKIKKVGTGYEVHVCSEMLGFAKMMFLA